MNAAPFRIDVPQETLDDLNRRLELTRWPNEIDRAGWSYGTNLAYLKELTNYWQHEFDWRIHEAKLNTFRQFRAEIDGFGLHFVHEPGKGPNPLPLLLTHGWPDSFWRFYKVIPMLTDPVKFGGNAEDAFDVVVPSLPGFGFSDKPTTPGTNTQVVADLFARLMSEVLGYTTFAAHGGDLGRGVTEQLARRHRDLLVAIHLTDLPFQYIQELPQSSLSEAEQLYVREVKAWQVEEGGYAAVQATKPQTLAYGLNDSPTGLAAWQIEKFRSWSDCSGDVERVFSKDDLLTNLTLYWVTETINSSFLPYYEYRHSVPKKSPSRLEVPTGVAIFPKDIARPPREFAERFFDLQRWNQMPRGGHFAALEEPELLVAELREFLRPYRSPQKEVKV